MELAKVGIGPGKQSLQRISDDESVENKKEAFLPALSKILPPLSEVLPNDASKIGGWITFIKDYVLNGLKFLGYFFAEELHSVANSVYAFSLNLWFDEKTVASVNYTFAQSLLKVAAPHHPDKLADTKGALLGRAKFVAILEKLPHTETKTTIADEKKLRTIIDSIKNGPGEHLRVKEWAFVSYKLDALAIDWQAELTKKEATLAVRENAYSASMAAVESELLIAIHDILENALDDSDAAKLDLRTIIRQDMFGGGEWEYISCVLRDRIFPQWKIALGKNVNGQIDRADVVALLPIIKSASAASLDNRKVDGEKLGALICDAKKKEQEVIEASNVVRRQQFILKNLDYLKHISRLEWANLAHEKILIQLEQYYTPLWKPGYVRSDSYTGSAGVAVGISHCGVTSGISATVTGVKNKFVDDQGCYVELNTISGGVTADLTVKVTPAIKLSAAVDGKLTRGSYTEWATARDYAASRFSALIKMSEHRDDPKIARYLSRSSTLADDDIKPGYAVWAANREEVAEIEKLKNEFDAIKNDVELQLSLMFTAVEHASVAEKKEFAKNVPESIAKGRAGVPIRFDAISVSKGLALSADVIGYSAKVGIEADVGISTDFSLNAAAAFQRKHLVQQVVVDTPICESLFDPARAEDKKVAVREELEARFNEFKNTVEESWKKEINALYDSTPLVNIDDEPNEPQRHSPCSLASNDDIVAWHANLQQDFAFYSNLHAGIALRKVKTAADDATLTQFAKRYGASTAEQLLHRMIIANAYLFSITDDIALKKNAMVFEQSLLSPLFTVDQKYLKERAYVKEDVDLENVENKFSLEVAFGEDLSGSGGSKFKLEGIKRRQDRTNPMRDGEYLDIVCTAAGTLGNITSLINSISAGLSKNLSVELAKQVTDQIRDQLSVTGPVGVAEYDKSYLFRFYKPGSFSSDFSYRHVFSRTLGTKEFKLGLGGAIPTGFVDVTFSAIKEKLLTDPEKDTFGASTILHFILLYMREYSSKLIDKETGAIDQSSHWNTIIKDQEAVLKKMFINYALEVEAERNDEDAGNISKDIAEIEKAIVRGGNAVTLEKFQKNTALFQNAVDDFARDTLSKEKYEAALTCFQNVMSAYYPHWTAQKNSSPLYLRRPLAPIEKPQSQHAEILVGQLRQQARQQLALNTI